MASAVVAPVPNENRSVASRMTKEGRRITYVLQVIQKPERARACGQGAKSSSDRRPVDPPPIVDLHVFEGDERDGRDITFTYNANFFLFATLENARPIAHGRIPAAQQNSPVLTGTPVAGMAYLDRPQPAGYFIFPDLSVRHEGKYRLAFTLFEDVKDLKDADTYQQGNGVQVHGRCEVKSSPFTVFSAKKFPGLTESTQLSRTVADQGCRVRIRRDVRMRRRNDKDSKEWDSYEDATAEQRANRSSTPESHAQHQLLAQNQQSIDSTDRSRSMSNASNASNHPMQPSRRTSAQDLQQSYQAGYMGHPVDVAAQQSQTQQPSTPHPAQHAVAAFVPPATLSAPPPSSTITPQPHISQSPQASAGYVQQGTYDQTHMAQYPPSYPPQHYVPSQPMAAYQQPQEYPFGGTPNASMPPTPQVQHQHQQPQPTGAQQQIQAMGPPSYGYMQQQAVYESNVPQVRPQESMECISQQRTNHASYNRGSVSSQYSASSHPISPLTQEDGGFARTPMSSMGMFNSTSASIAHGKDLPPLQVLEAAPHKTEMGSPMTSGGFEAGARPTPPGTFARGTAGKRSYGSTFNTQHIQEPLRAGARPNTVAGTVSMDASDGSDEDIDFEAFKLSYRRADGNRVQKVWSQSAL